MPHLRSLTLTAYQTNAIADWAALVRHYALALLQLDVHAQVPHTKWGESLRCMWRAMAACERLTTVVAHDSELMCASALLAATHSSSIERVDIAHNPSDSATWFQLLRDTLPCLHTLRISAPMAWGTAPFLYAAQAPFYNALSEELRREDGRLCVLSVAYNRQPPGRLVCRLAHAMQCAHKRHETPIDGAYPLDWKGQLFLGNSSYSLDSEEGKQTALLADAFAPFEGEENVPF